MICTPSQCAIAFPGLEAADSCQARRIPHVPVFRTEKSLVGRYIETGWRIN